MHVHVSKEQSVDNEDLVVVVWEREDAAANTPTIEARFKVYSPDWDDPKKKLVTLELLSTTRTDTRESITMTVEEKREIHRLAHDYASGDIDE